MLCLNKLTCAFPYDGIEFRTEESLSVVEDELNHHRLDPHLHECCRATKTGRFDLSGPETQLQYRMIYFTALHHWDMLQFAVTETLCRHWQVISYSVCAIMIAHLRRLGAQTIARFLVCMLVMGLKVARWERCLMRNSRVLLTERLKCNICTE